MTLSRSENVLPYSVLGRYHLEDGHLESPHFKEETDKFMLR